MSDLSDEDITCWLSCELAPPLIEALTELRRHRAALAPDKERVRSVAYAALLDAASAIGTYNDIAARCSQLADRAAEQLATPAGMSAEERETARMLRSTTRLDPRECVRLAALCFDDDYSIPARSAVSRIRDHLPSVAAQLAAAAGLAIAATDRAAAEAFVAWAVDDLEAADDPQWAEHQAGAAVVRRLIGGAR
jgi:hypothetical protein